MRLLVIAFAAWALLGAWSAAGDAKELLQNGGFEKDLDAWRPLDMAGGTTFESDAKVKHSGKQSLRIEKKTAGKLDFLKQSIDLPVRSGKLAFSIATQGGKECGARVDAYFFDAQGETLGKGFMTLVKIETSKAFVVTRDEYAIPDGAKGFGINVVVEKPGVVWIDSVSVTLAGAAKEKPKKKPRANVLEDGGFELGLDAWTDLPLGSETSTVTRNTSIEATGTASLQIERKSKRLFPEDGVQCTIAEPGDVKRFQLAVAARADADVVWCAVVQAFDADGVSVGVARLQAAGTGAFAKAQGLLTLEAPCDRLVVSLAARGAGSAFFDDVVLEAK